MKKQFVIAASVLAGGIVLLAATVVPKTAQQGISAKASIQLRKLDSYVGSWDVTGTVWSGGIPITTTGTAETHWALGGRFIKTDYSSEFAGTVFESLGLDGYDAGMDRYVSVWAASDSNDVTVLTGTFDAAGNLVKTSIDLSEGASTKARAKAVSRATGPDSHTVTGYTDNAGVWVKVIEATYTRK